MRNQEIIIETMEQIHMQEEQTDRLVARCKEKISAGEEVQCGAEPRKWTGSTRKKPSAHVLKLAVTAALICVVLFAVGGTAVYAGVALGILPYSLLDRFNSNEEDQEYIASLITGEAQSVVMNGIVFTVEDYVFEESLEEGYFVLSITGEDGTKPEIRSVSRNASGVDYSCFCSLEIDQKSYQIVFEGVPKEEPESVTVVLEDGTEEKMYFGESRIITIHAEEKEYAEAGCFYVRFRANADDLDFALYIMQTDELDAANVKEKKAEGECILLSDSIVESLSFEYGNLKGSLNPFTLQLTWLGQFQEEGVSHTFGWFPIEEISIVKKDGTVIPVISNHQPVEENLEWYGSRGNGVKSKEVRYQMINMININEVDYMLIDGEQVPVE